jgi:hypothetical protein
LLPLSKSLARRRRRRTEKLALSVTLSRNERIARMPAAERKHNPFRPAAERLRLSERALAV